MIGGLLIITGCGKSAMEKLAGTYKLEYSKYVGDPDTAKNTSEFSQIILNDNGTGKINHSGTIYEITWSLDDNNIKITEKVSGANIEYNGTVENDNKLDLYNGDKTNNLTVETVYIKEY